MSKNTYECENCGDEFKRYPSQIRGKHNFCSKECKHKFQRKTVECTVCGEEIEKIKSEIKGGNYFYCSKKCQSKNFRGENNPNWEGGSDRYRGPKWYEMRRKRKERDNHECVVCKKSKEDAEKSLEVHHIRPFKEFEKPKDANHIDNLITVCMSCHRMMERNNSS